MSAASLVAPQPEFTAEWPPEVDMILSAMDAAGCSRDRRSGNRRSFRARARLTLYADADRRSPWVLFTRDVDRRMLGFITPDLLPLGYGGWLDLPMPDGELLRIDCTLIRCRKAIEGWHEGALKFNREVWQLEPG